MPDTNNQLRGPNDQPPATIGQRPILHNGFKGRVFAACFALVLLALALTYGPEIEAKRLVADIVWAFLMFASAVIAGHSVEQWSVYRGGPVTSGQGPRTGDPTQGRPS